MYLNKLNTKWAIFFATNPFVLIEGLTNAHNDFIAVGLAILGTGASSTYYPDKWENKTTKEMKAFRKKFGEDKLKEASGKFNDKYKEWIQKRVKMAEYQKLSDEDKQKDLTKKKTEIKKLIFKQYGFK